MSDKQLPSSFSYNHAQDNPLLMAQFRHLEANPGVVFLNTKGGRSIWRINLCQMQGPFEPEGPFEPGFVVLVVRVGVDSLPNKYCVDVLHEASGVDSTGVRVVHNSPQFNEFMLHIKMKVEDFVTHMNIWSFADKVVGVVRSSGMLPAAENPLSPVCWVLIPSPLNNSWSASIPDFDAAFKEYFNDTHNSDKKGN